jgi:CheY-specific phosphatase CheX
MMTDNTQLIQNFKSLVQNSLEKRAKDFLQCQTVDISPLPEPLSESDVLANQMVLIQVYGQNMVLSLKFMFNIKDIRPLVSQYLDKSVDEISWLQVIDLMKEFANLTTGHIKAVLSYNNFVVLCSMPVATRGYHQIFSEKKEGDSVVYSEGVVLDVGEAQMFVCTTLESMQSDVLAQIKLNVDIDEESEEVEFL